MPRIEVPLGTGSVITLPPGGTQSVTLNTTFVDIKPAAMQTILRGERAFVVWLRAKYSDPFSDTRDTLECWFYVPRLKALVYCPGQQYHR
jgi:hypothetical protein